jgi:hypothetical protein
VALLLHLFAELFHELLDLPTLRCGMARGVVQWALRATVVTIGRLMGAFVASRPAMAPTCRSSCGSGHSGQRLVATSLLLLIVAAATALAWAPALGLLSPFAA